MIVRVPRGHAARPELMTPGTVLFKDLRALSTPPTQISLGMPISGLSMIPVPVS